MYFENSDQCELSVRYHLTQVQAEAWDKVLSELDALCKLADNPLDWGEERRNLENVLIEVISEVIYDNSDEERPPAEATGWDYGCDSYYASEEACWEHGDEDVA